MFCPLKFSSWTRDYGEKAPLKPNAECEGVDCELFNVDYGKCSIYLLALTPGEKVKLEHSNSGRKK